MQNLKALLVVSVIAAAVFFLFSRMAGSQVDAHAYRRRRTAWFLLTAAAFLLPNFWLFACVSIPVILWIGRGETNRVAAYLLLSNVVPGTTFRLPMIGMSHLLYVSFSTVLVVFLLLPEALRLRRGSNPGGGAKLDKGDWLLIGYCTLSSFLFVHPELSPGVLMSSTTPDDLRRLIGFILSPVIPYFVISRSGSDPRKLLDSMSAFVLGCMIMAAISVFEAVRHWLLYAVVMNTWSGIAGSTMYLMRGDSLRAMASSGHPLALGTMLAVAFGLLLGLQRYLSSNAARISLVVLCWAGLFAAYSRGPWIGAVTIAAVFALISHSASSRVVRMGAYTILAAGIVYMSPLGDMIRSVLPVFGGATDDNNIIYRQRLFERSWSIITSSPWLGDQQALLKMQDLRQGEGIIDLVNGYVVILLNNGLVGLTTFLSFIAVGVTRAWSASKAMARSDPRFAPVGDCLISCIVGLLLMAATGGSNDGLIATMAGLSCAFARACRQPPPQGHPVPGVNLLKTSTR